MCSSCADVGVLAAQHVLAAHRAEVREVRQNLRRDRLGPWSPSVQAAVMARRGRRIDRQPTTARCRLRRDHGRQPLGLRGKRPWSTRSACARSVTPTSEKMGFAGTLTPATPWVAAFMKRLFGLYNENLAEGVRWAVQQMIARYRPTKTRGRGLRQWGVLRQHRRGERSDLLLGGEAQYALRRRHARRSHRWPHLLRQGPVETAGGGTRVRRRARPGPGDGERTEAAGAAARALPGAMVVAGVTSGVDAIALVYGYAAASVVIALTTADAADTGRPHAVARGWWSIAPAPGARDALERAGELLGMVIEAGGAPCALVTLKDADGLATFIVGSDEGSGNAARLAAWSAHAPRAVSVRAAQRLLSELEGVNGREISTRLLQRLGFGEVRRGEPWEELDGAIGPVLWDNLPYVGTKHFDVRSQRWRFASLPVGVGLWDFDGPSHPIEQWPTPEEATRIDMSARGWLKPYDEQAWRRWCELVARPILEQTVLDGDRAWGQINYELQGTLHSARFVLHRSCDGVVSEFNVYSPYNTLWHMDGRISVLRANALLHGVDGPTPDSDRPWEIEVPNRNFDDVKTAFKLQRAPGDEVLLIDIPDSVPRYFLETCAFVRAATHPRHLPEGVYWSLNPDDDGW